MGAADVGSASPCMRRQQISEHPRQTRASPRLRRSSRSHRWEGEAGPRQESRSRGRARLDSAVALGPIWGLRRGLKLQGGQFPSRRTEGPCLPRPPSLRPWTPPPQRSGQPPARRRGRRSPARATANGSRRRVGGIRSRCSRISRRGRLQELVPIRLGRMLASPFTFFRGAAAIMAMDLAKTPDSGLRVQACGDAHLSNFGVFASPDRREVFGRQRLRRDPSGALGVGPQAPRGQLRDRRARPRLHLEETRAAVLRTVRSYREAMREFAAMRNLDVWYARLDVDTVLAELAKVASAKRMKEARKGVKKAGKKNSLRAFDRLVRVVDGSRGSSATRRCWFPRGSSSPRISARSSRGGSSR